MATNKVINVRPIVPVIGAGIGLYIGHLKKKPLPTTLLYGAVGAGTAYAAAATVMSIPQLTKLITAGQPVTKLS